ncbi:MAG TPA: helicase-related protein [Caulobacteraceae bacterium]|jgi:hypothetical protein|nr:helicase-related protein [Caulobacteraceae bacterium]
MTADLSSYHAQIAAKRVQFQPHGLAKVPALNGAMFPHQEAVTEFALAAGSAALFLDTGLGKTFCALEWGRVVVEHTNKPVLMLAPLACAKQHEGEAHARSIDAEAIREAAQVRGSKVYITNYDRLDRFDPALFGGVILDESSILKSFTGKTTRALISSFDRTPFRLACTATPAPNDHMELGQHSAFLGAMASSEMLSRWFIADQTNMGRYRLKDPAILDFWNWVASWSRAVSKPSDLGFSDEGFALPELVLQRHVLAADRSTDTGEERDGQARLFRIPETSATSIHREKRLTIEMRADEIARVVALEPGEAWVVWCDTDYEADALMARIPDAVEVRGSHSIIQKENRLAAFASGQTRILISKPSVCGYGLNWQHCARQAFVGLSFSYESFYQAVRRCWRFGQKRPVHVHVACADTEEAIWNVISRKSGDHDEMKSQMTAAMKRAISRRGVLDPYTPQQRAEFPPFIKGAA